MDGLVDDEGHGGGVVGVGDLGVEEDLRPEEALVGDVALPRLGGLRQAVDLLGPLGRVVVVLAELLGHVRANVAVFFLDALCDIHCVICRYGCLALSK